MRPLTGNFQLFAVRPRRDDGPDPDFLDADTQNLTRKWHQAGKKCVCKYLNLW
jgi:hypothetical protein